MRGHGKEMMHQRALRVFGAAVSSLILSACADGDRPYPDAELRDQIEQRYVDGVPDETASAGGTSGRAGSGGSGAGSAGRNAGGGSGGSAGSGSQPSGECNSGFDVLATNCVGGMCHGAGSPYSNFAESEEAALAFVGESGVSSCSAEGPLLNPDNPAASIIIQKVT